MKGKCSRPHGKGVVCDGPECVNAKDNCSYCPFLKYKINVEQRHIDAGVRINAFSCPIALAVSEATGKEAGVCSQRINLYPVGDAVLRDTLASFKTPYSAKRFIRQFDARGKVKPFTFKLSNKDYDSGR